MKTVLRWTGIAVGVVAGLIVIAAGIVYAMSERVLTRTWPIPKVVLTVPGDEGSIAEGRRQAQLYGCIHACHGKEGEGRVMFDQPAIARVVAPSLGAAARRYDTAQLGAIIRHGVRPDGRSMIVMPSEAFAPLTDDDLAKIIAFLRTLPPSVGTDATQAYGPLGRVGLVTGKFRMVAQIIAESTPPPEVPVDAGGQGRYLARTACGGCHAPDLRGTENPSFVSADLAIVGAYTPEAFVKLMRTGVGLGDRPLRVMPGAVRDQLAVLRDDEIGALYGYLHALPAARAPSQPAGQPTGQPASPPTKQPTPK